MHMQQFSNSNHKFERSQQGKHHFQTHDNRFQKNSRYNNNQNNVSSGGQLQYGCDSSDYAQF